MGGCPRCLPRIASQASAHGLFSQGPLAVASEEIVLFMLPAQLPGRFTETSVRKFPISVRDS
jgi:hypothetical protein